MDKATNKNKVLESGLTLQPKASRDEKDAELKKAKAECRTTMDDRNGLLRRIGRITAHNEQVAMDRNVLMAAKDEEIRVLTEENEEHQKMVKDHGNWLQIISNDKKKKVTLAQVEAEYERQLKATKAEDESLTAAAAESQNSFQSMKVEKEEQLDDKKAEVDKIQKFYNAKLQETEGQVKNMTDQKTNLESNAAKKKEG